MTSSTRSWVEPSPKLAIKPSRSSSGLFDRRIAGSRGFSGPFRPPRTGRAGFRWTGGGADRCTKSPKPPSDPRRGEHDGIMRPFPGQTEIRQGLGRGEAGCTRQRRAMSSGRPAPGCGPTASSIRGSPSRTGTCARCRSDGDRRASTGRGPALRPGPPQPERLLHAGDRLGEMLDLDADHAAPDDRRWCVAQRPGQSVGCIRARLVTVTVP